MFSTFAAVLLLSGFCVTVPSIAQSKDSVVSGSGKALSGEEVFGRFARSVVVVMCRTWDDHSVIGSGLIASPEGYVITNAHVVEDAERIEVYEPKQPTDLEAGLDILMSRFQAVAKAGQAPKRMTNLVKAQPKPFLVYIDVEADIAVLKTPLKNVPFDLSVTSAPGVGERVYAIGNPIGLEQTITEGIVSGIRRQKNRLFIQHSAAIAPGSSGGALVSEHGALVGMNTFSLKDSQNLNFAIPAEALNQALMVGRKSARPVPISRTANMSSDSVVPSLFQGDFMRTLFAGAVVGLLVLVVVLFGFLMFALSEIRLWRGRMPDPAAAPLPPTRNIRSAMLRRAWLVGSLLWVGFWGILVAVMNDDPEASMMVEEASIILFLCLPLILGPVGLGIYRFIVHGRITAPDKAKP